jgi:hypothetical protein|nr:MAG TPA: hypothetical protein [Crassvirales sp.]
MENKVPDELLNIFLKDGQEVDGQLPNPTDVVELPDDVVKDIWEDHETDYWVLYNKDNPIDQ